MKRSGASLLIVLLFCVSALAQLDHIMIPAGTPEDKALQAITAEQDAEKRVPMYVDFVQKFSANPAAVAYGNWQLSQYYQAAGDLPKALAYGDSALASLPNQIEILVSQTGIAQAMKDDAKITDYATRGGAAYNAAGKQKPEGMSDEDFAAKVKESQEAAKNSYQFLETSAYNAIGDEKDPKARMGYIERFTAAFPDSTFAEPVAQLAMYTLGPGQLNDSARLVAFGEKTLATNPNSIPALLLLANAYVEDTRPASVAKAATYSEKVIELSKGAEAPDADRSKKLTAGSAHNILGYALMKQEKTAASVPELKTAAQLLKGQDDVSYAVATYRLGYAYAKLNKMPEAKEALNEVAKMDGPMQQPARDLLAKVNGIRAKAK